MIRCGFCHFGMGTSPTVRRRLRNSKCGKVFCTNNCHKMFQEQERIQAKR